MPQFSLIHLFSAEHCSLFGKVIYTSLVITLLNSYYDRSHSQNNTTKINVSNITMLANDVISSLLISNNLVTEASGTRCGNILHEVIVLVLINQDRELLKISGVRWWIHMGIKNPQSNK